MFNKLFPFVITEGTFAPCLHILSLTLHNFRFDYILFYVFYCFQEKFLMKEKESIEKTIKECEEKARKEAERVAKLHQQDIDRLNER